MTVLVEIDGNVIQRGNKNAVGREERRAYGLQLADSLLADNQLSGELLAVGLEFIDHREIFVGQNTATTNHDHIRVFTVDFSNQRLMCIHNQRVEIFVMTGFANFDGRGNHLTGFIGDAAHHAVWRIVAVFLQPADRHILKKRILLAVRGCRPAYAVKADGDVVQRLTFDDRVADAGLEVLKARPQIELVIFQVVIEVHRLTEIAIGIHLRKIGGLALHTVVGVSGAGNGAVNINADFLLGQLAHHHHVDLLQEGGRLLDFFKQRLRH